MRRHDSCRPVTTGTRITISYKLYAQPMDPVSPGLQPGSFPFQQALAAALRDPYFPPPDCRLGFACAHLYSYTADAFGPRLQLKGRMQW